ncbi:hypothetical protein H0H92_000937 [Tricholoma furcatifolium]|nr:hypothetical protein H0H92_000937 [Tricholoma furcatifolium]
MPGLNGLPHGLVRIRGKYRLKHKIGAGAFGDVYQATNVVSGAPVAVKLEASDNEHHRLCTEWNTYQALGAAVGIPRAFWFGHENGYNAMLMSLLGPSIEDIFEQQDKQFTTHTVLMIGAQLNFIHRDIKPANLLIGLQPSTQSIIHIADFGLAMRYCDAIGNHLPLCHSSSFTGTLRFMSINAHRGFQLSRRDDLESLAYVLIYLHNGFLPWQGISRSSSKKTATKSALVLDAKLNFTCDSQLPQALSNFLFYARELAFDADPDYQFLKNLFSVALSQHNDRTFDWI